jgi:mRNA interferase RelE/StbE
MPYTVSINPKAEKFLAAVRDAKLYRRLRKAVDELSFAPRPVGCLKMQGDQELYRIRVGDYRIIYEVRDRQLVVLVVRIGNRREVYR